MLLRSVLGTTMMKTEMVNVFVKLAVTVNGLSLISKSWLNNDEFKELTGILFKQFEQLIFKMFYSFVKI